MTAGLNDRDWELLSAYLDSSLSPAETREVEARLKKEPEFNAAYGSMRRTRIILRAVPDVKRRRNFYVTPQMASQGKWSWLIPVFNYSSLATGLVAVILVAMNLIPVGMKSAPASQAMMPAPAIIAATAPIVENSAAQPAAAPAEESKQEISTQPVVENDTQTQADQATGPAMELAAPAPATGAVTGEQPTSPVENFVAPAPQAAAPKVEGESEPAPAAPEMKAAGSGMVSEPTAGMTMAGAAVENGAERQKIAPTMTLEPIMESAPLEITDTSVPTMVMPTAVVPVWTAESPTMKQEAASVSSPAAYAATEISPMAENVVPAISSPTAIQAKPESLVPPAKSQLTTGGYEISVGWMGGILLFVSIMLGFTGFILGKRLR
jgi:anti-sigma factor RsiW